MREGNFNRVERAERVEKGLGVSSQELVSGEVIAHAKSAKFAKSDVGNVLTQRHKGSESWPMVRLGDVCEVVSGNSAPQDKSLYENGVYPFVRTSDVGLIHFGKLNKTRDYLNEEGIYKLRKFSKGSILFPKSGASTFLNHRVLLEIDAYVASHLAVISPITKKVSSEYMLFLLSTIDAKDLLQDSNYPALRSSEIEGIQIPLPPIEVQKEIVERLEKELGEADKVAAEFKRMAELADKEFKAELDETFNSLSANSASPREIKNDGVGGFVTRGAAEDAEKWPMVRLGDVCETISTRGHQIKQAEIKQVGRYPVVTQSENEIEGFTDDNICINDVPIVLFGDHTCVVKAVGEPFVVGADGAKLLKPRGVDFEYLVLIVKKVASGLVDGKYRRHYSDLVESVIPLPPFSVQKEIVVKLDAAKERCEKLKAEAERGLRASENLRKAILSEAFE